MPQAKVKRLLPRISVVDDDPDLLAFFKGLADIGHFVLIGAYSNAGDALAHIVNSPPDIVFMDLLLPDMSGIECTRRLTAILPDLMVVVLTGHSDEQTFVMALQAGAKGFLIKPCTLEETLTAIEDIGETGAVLGKTAFPYVQRIIRQLGAPDPSWNLTEREKQVLACIMAGMSDKKIAAVLNMGEATVHTHTSHLFEKLGVHSRSELIAKVLQPAGSPSF